MSGLPIQRISFVLLTGNGGGGRASAGSNSFRFLIRFPGSLIPVSGGRSPAALDVDEEGFVSRNISRGEKKRTLKRKTVNKASAAVTTIVV